MKTVLITGSTDGIGYETAKKALQLGHEVLVHGRNRKKLEGVIKRLKTMFPKSLVRGYLADLTDFIDIAKMIDEINKNVDRVDVLINNAGIFNLSKEKTKYGVDKRFLVNAISPYILTKKLLPLISKDGRVINLSSAAQVSFDLEEISKGEIASDQLAYAKSKLALTMWSIQLGLENIEKEVGPTYIAVNPKSFLGTKMVKEAYGTKGYDLSIGADIVTRLAFDDEFAMSSGKYYDNDIGRFSSPHSDALDKMKRKAVIDEIERIAKKFGD